MIRCYAVVLFLLAPVFAMAQHPDWGATLVDVEKEKPSWDEVKGSFLPYGEYNVCGKSPIAGAELCCNIGYIKGGVEFGWSYLSQFDVKNHFYYVAFSVGPQIGNKTKFYAQIGGTTWGEYVENDFYSNVWRVRTKIGTDIYLAEKVYLNIGANYIIPYRKDVDYNSKMFSVRMGLGFRF